MIEFLKGFLVSMGCLAFGLGLGGLVQGPDAPRPQDKYGGLCVYCEDKVPVYWNDSKVILTDLSFVNEKGDGWLAGAPLKETERGGYETGLVQGVSQAARCWEFSGPGCRVQANPFMECCTSWWQQNDFDQDGDVDLLDYTLDQRSPQ